MKSIATIQPDQQRRQSDKETALGRRRRRKDMFGGSSSHFQAPNTHDLISIFHSDGVAFFVVFFRIARARFSFINIKSILNYAVNFAQLRFLLDALSSR